MDQPQKIPAHLEKYIVDQNYEKYTPEDQAVWRYILRQLVSFLRIHGHPFYLEGLQRTGIQIDSIPKISDISKKLETFGWQALPVSGFIPPAAFMELQSLNVLPVASDLRTIDHLMYTPAPDIVHEAAGHAPMLAHPEFAAYLRRYAEVAKNAILSKQDLDVYEAIRDLSDIKENPDSTHEQIQAAQIKLDQVTKSSTYVSEAAELGRMNWWTAEYGLYGSPSHPRILGAGLLSSVGESEWCLNKKVKKLPLTVDCLKQSYDITEPQPQLFVVPHFSVLVEVLDEMASQMAFRTGGIKGLAKALKAETVNTAEWSSGLQASGVLSEIIQGSMGHPIYLKFQGPTELCYQNQVLDGHNKQTHAQGFSAPVGRVHGIPGCPSQFSQAQLSTLNWIKGQQTDFIFESGIRIQGEVTELVSRNGQHLLLSLKNCTVTNGHDVLFQPHWGVYDMPLGEAIVSVLGGPADRISYGETHDFVAAKVKPRTFSGRDIERHKAYKKIRDLREGNPSTQIALKASQDLFKMAFAEFKSEWLLFIEIYEVLISSKNENSPLAKDVHGHLEYLATADSKVTKSIQDGLKLSTWSSEQLMEKT